MRLLLIDDDPECLDACAEELREGGHTVSTFESAAEALRAVDPTQIDVAVLDLELNGESSFETMRWIHSKAKDLPIVALTGHASDDYVFAALRAGAVGYVLKHSALGALSRVVQEAAAGGTPMTPTVARRVLGAFRASVRDEAAAVVESDDERPTRREIDVLDALARGLTYQECGSALGIGLDTVRTHVRNVYRKLHASSKAEAVALALRHGWLG